MRQKPIIYLIISGFLCMFFGSQAQKPLTVERVDHLSLVIKRGETISFSLNLGKGDRVDITGEVKGNVNFRVSDPAGRIIRENRLKHSPLQWSYTCEAPGTYAIALQSAALILKSKVSMTVRIQKFNFSYGDPSMDSLIAERTRKVLTEGDFAINRAHPRTYPYPLKKGDTLLFSLTSLSGKRPAIQITNDLNELVFARLAGKGAASVSIPVFESGTYTISMKSNSFFGKSNKIKTESISPARYIARPAPPAPPEDTTAVLPVVPYDTIPEVYMDTTVFLGGIRDIIHKSIREIRFNFVNPSSIVYWCILYGAGEQFKQEVASYQSAGAGDMLTAYGLGYLKNLPGPGSEQIKFEPSYSIRRELKPPLHANYARINSAWGTHSLTIKNKSQSFGQNAYVKVVVFRRVLAGSE